jgi:hypothetical protein
MKRKKVFIYGIIAVTVTLAFTACTEDDDLTCNHNWGEWTVTTAPTCTTEGTETRICNHNASHTETQSIVSSHNWGEWTITTTPTCTTTGVGKRICTLCNIEAPNTVIPTLDYHNFGNWTLTTLATCMIEGEETESCIDCLKLGTEKQPVAINPEAHNWSNIWTLVTYPAITGKEEIRCQHSGCTAQETRPAPPTPGLAFIEVDGGFSVSRGSVLFAHIIIIPAEHRASETDAWLPVIHIARYGFHIPSHWPPYITGIFIPNSVTTIGDQAFTMGHSLTSIHVDADNPNFSSANGVVYNKDQTTIMIVPPGISGHFVIPDSVTTIGRRAFEACTGLTSITIPNGVTTIGDYAFIGCNSLKSITLPNSVTTIGDYAFFGCNSLKSITLPNSVTTIGDFAFVNCDSLTSITIPNNVTTIGLFAFGDSLTNITLPMTGARFTFLSASSVKTVIINGGTTIPDWSFTGYTSLTSITIPDSITTIGDGAFMGCTGLTSVTIPDSVTTIGEMAFQNCTGLTSVIIPDSITTIGRQTFVNCTGLTNITIPDSVTSIGNNAFTESGLTSITIPNSVTTIGTGAFSDCTDLTSIIIPDSVTSIGDWAFSGCTNLTSVVLEGATPPTLEIIIFGYTPLPLSRAFDNTHSDLRIFVPAGSAAAYRSNSRWMNILINRIHSVGCDLPNADGTNGWFCSCS